MQFACYRGKALISRLIQGFTRSVYSHCAVQFADGAVFEAVANGFVKAASLGENHEAGTIIDLFEYRTPLNAVEVGLARGTAEKLVGAPYDYLNVFVGFPLRLANEPASSRSKLFCSEACLALSWAMGEERLLQRMLPWKATPDHIGISPLLRWVETVTVKKS